MSHLFNFGNLITLFGKALFVKLEDFVEFALAFIVSWEEQMHGQLVFLAYLHYGAHAVLKTQINHLIMYHQITHVSQISGSRE